jgi:hypothetical protein
MRHSTAEIHGEITLYNGARTLKGEPGKRAGSASSSIDGGKLDS